MGKRTRQKKHLTFEDFIKLPPSKAKYTKVSHLLDGWMDIFIQYNNLLQLNHTEQLTPGQKKLFSSLTKDLEDTYSFIAAHLTERMKEGDTVPVNITLTALGSNALDLPWFTDSLKTLIGNGKTIQLSLPKDKDYTPLINRLREFEKHLMEGVTLYDAAAFIEEEIPLNTLKTHYHRHIQSSKFLFIILLRYTFIFLHPSPHKLLGRLPGI